MLKIFELCLLTSLLTWVNAIEFSTTPTNNENEDKQQIEAMNKQLERLSCTVDNLQRNLTILERKFTLLQKHFTNLDSIFENQETEIDAVHECRTQSRKNYTEGMKLNTTQDKWDEHFNFIGNLSSITNASKSCAEAHASNGFKDDIYLLNIPQSELKPFYAFCSHGEANDSAWIIIQRRVDGAVNFNRSWSDYKCGFGDLYGEYWIGLERLHALTKAQPHELWISLRDYEDKDYSALYGKFSIASEGDGYALSLDDFHGDLNDAFSYHSEAKFSTFDNDNDLLEENCAVKYTSGWWFKNCYKCNLNGIYYTKLTETNSVGVGGVIWVQWHGYGLALKYVHMAIRPL